MPVILDLLIGLFFIYLLLSLMVNGIQEFISAVMKWRNESLLKWIEQSFPQNISDFIDHPLLNGRSAKGKSPSYFNSKAFSIALTEMLAKSSPANAEIQGGLDIEHLKKKYSLTNLADSIQNNQELNPEIKDMLMQFISKSALWEAAKEKEEEIRNGLEHFQMQVSRWFDSSMERLSSRYKRNALLIGTLISFSITLTMQVDSLSLINYFYRNPAQTAALADQVSITVLDSNSALSQKIHDLKAYAKKNKDTVLANAAKIQEDLQQLKQVVAEKDSLMKQVQQASLPIGWQMIAEEQALLEKAKAAGIASGNSFTYWLKKILGWLMTTLAISLGGPFWFDMLNKVANIRSVVKAGGNNNASNKKTSTN